MLSETTCNDLKPCDIIWNHLTSFEVMRKHVKPHWISWSHLNNLTCFGISWSHMILFWINWSYFKPFDFVRANLTIISCHGNCLKSVRSSAIFCKCLNCLSFVQIIWMYVRAFENLWSHFEPFAITRHQLRSFNMIWNHLEAFETIQLIHHTSL